MSFELNDAKKEIRSIVEQLYDDAWKDGYTCAYKEMIAILQTPKQKEDVQ